MKLTTVEGMKSEIFVPVTSVPVFTELKSVPCLTRPTPLWAAEEM